MVLALCILGVAMMTLLLIAVVDRPTTQPQQPVAPVAPQQEILDPYVMR